MTFSGAGFWGSRAVTYFGPAKAQLKRLSHGTMPKCASWQSEATLASVLRDRPPPGALNGAPVFGWALFAGKSDVRPSPFPPPAYRPASADPSRRPCRTGGARTDLRGQA